MNPCECETGAGTCSPYTEICDKTEIPAACGHPLASCDALPDMQEEVLLKSNGWFEVNFDVSTGLITAEGGPGAKPKKK
jgi:hypothetical protein